MCDMHSQLLHGLPLYYYYCESNTILSTVTTILNGNDCYHKDDYNLMLLIKLMTELCSVRVFYLESTYARGPIRRGKSVGKKITMEYEKLRSLICFVNEFSKTERRNIVPPIYL